jgi:hypothetical protein
MQQGWKLVVPGLGLDGRFYSFLLPVGGAHVSAGRCWCEQVFLGREMGRFSLANRHLWGTHGSPTVCPSVGMVIVLFYRWGDWGMRDLRICIRHTDRISVSSESMLFNCHEDHVTPATWVSLFFSLSLVLGDRTQGLTRTRQVLSHWPPTPAQDLFILYFEFSCRGTLNSLGAHFGY